VDYDRLSEGVCAQLIEGELVMTPAPTPWHERLVAQFMEELVLFFGPRSGRVMPSKFEISIGTPPDEEIVQPDVVVLPAGAKPTGRSSWKPPTPVLVAEVLSPSTESYDRGSKLRIYAAAGVKEVWLLDPAGQTIEVHQLAAATRRLFADGHVAESSVLPGFRVDVVTFFAP
jgi:Uma2 family endonuclease